MSQTILDAVGNRIILLDGGFGTELIAHGFPRGECPELWNVEKPDIVQSIHKSYFEAGADAVLTNSFGGSRIKLEAYDLGHRCYELNLTAAKNATDVRPAAKFVGGSIGPTGKLLKPVGSYEESQFEAAYAEQVKGLADGGVDFLLIETQYDLTEALCALRGARQVTDKPVFVTMTFKIGPRGYFTEWGNSVAQCVKGLEKEGVPAVGANCTLDSEEMIDLIKIIRENTSLPIIAQANAGKPSLSDQGEVSYEQSIEDYVRFIPEIIRGGANIVGGCCGTNPAYIKRMAEIIEDFEIA
jgi:5-methyltetrahydrofolate--homocysteine methyltransferase